MTTSPLITVLGATGTIGTDLVPRLLATGTTVRAVTRDPARRIPGAQRVIADLRDPGTLRPALAGADALFLNSPSSEDAAALQIRAADLAHELGISRLVLLSQHGARTDSPVRFLRWHGEVEQHVRSLGIDHTVLRPNLYLQSLLGLAETISRGILAAPITEARVSAVDTRDVAAAAAAVLTGTGHSGRTYTLTGPAAITHREIAEALSRATGTAITFHPLPAEDFAAALSELLPAWQVHGLVEDYAHYARGEADEVHHDITALTGAPARDVDRFARDHAPAFTRP